MLYLISFSCHLVSKITINSHELNIFFYCLVMLFQFKFEAIKTGDNKTDDIFAQMKANITSEIGRLCSLALGGDCVE